MTMLTWSWSLILSIFHLILYHSLAFAAHIASFSLYCWQSEIRIVRNCYSLGNHESWVVFAYGISATFPRSDVIRFSVFKWEQQNLLTLLQFREPVTVWFGLVWCDCDLSPEGLSWKLIIGCSHRSVDPTGLVSGHTYSNDRLHPLWGLYIAK